MPDDIQRGIEILREGLKVFGLRLSKCRPISGGARYYCEIALGVKSVDTVVSREFLADLPGTREYQDSLRDYLACIQGRLHNFSPRDFLCGRGVPLTVDFDWDGMGRVAYRDASYLHAYVYDIRFKTVAKCTLIRYGTQWHAVLKSPFIREQATIQAIRTAVDEHTIGFWPDNEHPSELQRIDIPPLGHAGKRATEAELERFLAAKVYWLGFRRGDKHTKVWVADPRDADYLGVKSADLLQAAQILEAEEKIVLEAAFASAGSAILKERHLYERAGTLSAPPTGLEHEWDVFICHASEDKDNFVRSLAQALQDRNLRVWYDEFVLKVGGRLLERIDYGLQRSRYGVVVLSQAFFSKSWTRTELDGLAAKESTETRVILPVWYDLDESEVKRYSPILAGRIAAKSKDGIERIVRSLLAAMGRQ